MQRLLFIIITFVIIPFTYLSSQPVQNENYQFNIDLTKAEKDFINIELITPQVTEENISYRFPAMVPGTYKIYDFGRYISDLKAFDNAGGELTVTKGDVNTWDISDATKLYKITYRVRDTFEDTSGISIFEPAGTSIEPGKIFVFNNHGFFGYLDGYIGNKYELTFTKPAGFYGSTSLDAIERTDDTEILTAPDYHYLVDNPIFFDKPDTATISFDEAKILISVYSPGKGMTAKDIADDDKVLLGAIRTYLGGKLPTDRYTFLYYFSNNKKGSGGFGALEHNNSSLYYMPDVPLQAKQMMLNQLQSTSAHEFYHTVTPLNLHSEEIGNFDFNNPVMSEHLWLYEGVTEYNANYIQLREGLMNEKDYATSIENKISAASRYNDTLPFTEMSKGALDKYEQQYTNVYEKGALIGLCLDILIRQESNGQQGLQDVINKLSEKYGKTKPFKDEDLFGEIEVLTSPKVREFLDMYVGGPDKIPYDEIFAKIGLTVNKIPYEALNTGGISLGYDPENYRLKIVALESDNNKFVTSLGIKTGDELVSFNGKAISFQNYKDIFGSFKKPSKIGETFELVVARKDVSGTEKMVTLKTTVDETKTSYDYKVSFADTLSTEQQQLKNSWLGK